MQIILSNRECEIIHEALLSEIREATQQLKLDEQRGRDTKYAKKYLEDVEAIWKRVSGYVG